jgi:hypothetical protein
VGGLVLGAFAWRAHVVTAGQGGVPLDDAWIHFQFARNIARGAGFSFNPGHPTAGSTAPLWTLLLAGVYFLGGRFPVAGQALSGLFFLTTLVSTYALGLRLTEKRWAAWLAALVVAVNGRVAWAGLSALEIGLFSTLSLLALQAHLTDRARRRYRVGTAALFGLAALARPEGYLLFGMAMVDFVGLLALRGTGSWRARARRLPLLPGLTFVALVAPSLIFSLRTSGHLLPNTYHAKAVVTLLPDRDFLSLTARYLILDNPLLLPFYLLGLLVGGVPLLSAWSAGLPLAYAFLHASLYQHGRYLMPLIPCNALLAVLGLLEAGKLARRRGIRWRGSRAALWGLLTLLVVAGTAWRLPTMATLYAQNVDNINEMHVALGRWAAENTPEDATLALNDIGAIAYVSQRPVVDLAGLVTPEVLPILRGPDSPTALLEFMAAQGVDYTIIFPTWFPGLAAREEALEPVHRVTLTHNTIAGGETMVVYRNVGPDRTAGVK